MANPSHTRVCAKCTLVYSEKCSSLQHQESQNPDQAQSNTAISATQREMSTAVTDLSQALFSLHLLCGKFETNFQKESNFTDEENGADCNQISRTLKSVRETLVYYWVCGLLLATVKSEGEHLTGYLTAPLWLPIHLTHTTCIPTLKACPPLGSDANGKQQWSRWERERWQTPG